MAESGFQSLIDALKSSGMSMDGLGGSSAGNGAGAGASGAGFGSSGSGSAGAGGARGATDSGSGSAGSAGGGGNSEPPTVQVMSSLRDSMASWTKKTIVIAIVVAILIILAAYWWFHPPISINSPDCWMFVVILILLPCYLFFRARARRYEAGATGGVSAVGNASSAGGTRAAKKGASSGKAHAFKIASYIPVAIVVLGILGSILSLSLFPGNAQKYASVLKTDQLDFSQDIKEVDYNEIPVIDRNSAILLGNREMGSIPDYVSQFEVSNLYSQINYQGSPVRVSPLGYADLFKWLTNREQGIPAYALVNMTTQDAEIVRLGEGQGMKYTASEPLARNIDRYIQLKYPFYIFDEKSFEIDEEGTPWWICPVREYTIGLFGGETISKVVLCNASTGECEELAVKDCPQWVDRVYPAELLIRQYNWSGKYASGWFNSWLGQSGVVQTTPGTDGTLGYNYIAKDDDVWVYTGVTSATADNSIVGFVLVNQRTAESHYYAVSGATEASAMESAEGQVQNLRYTSTFPLLINVSNQPTYFMALKDGAGLVKKFAMIDIQRYQNVAVGDTVADCQKSYESLLATNGAISGDDLIDSESYSSASGVIRTIYQAVVEGNSHFYVTLEGDSAIYDFILPNAIQIVGYDVGDSIAFDYIKGEPTNTVSEITTGETAAVRPPAGATASGFATAGAAGAAGTTGADATDANSSADAAAASEPASVSPPASIV